MNNIVFCTLAYGDKYINFSHNLINQILGKGYNFMVYTSDTSKYEYNELLEVIENKNEYFSFHQKLEIVEIALKKYNTVIFLDSDVEIIGNPDFAIFDDIEQGLHILGTFGALNNSFLNKDNGKCLFDERNGKYGNEGEDFLLKNNLKFKKIYHGVNEDYLEHFLEGKWIIKKDGNENKFFEIWKQLSEFTNKIDIENNFTNNIGAGEGASMSIAAYNSNIKLHIISPLSGFMHKFFISNYSEKVNNIKPWDGAG